jgi:hypothetical protein
MKWRPHGDNQDPDSTPEEAVGERLATPPDRRAGAGTVMRLNSACLGETIASLRQTGNRTETRVFGKRTMGRVVRNSQGRGWW